MLSITTAQQALKMIEDIFKATYALNKFWISEETNGNRELVDLVHQYFPFEATMTLHDLEGKLRNWMDNVDSEVHKIVNCTELVDNANEKIWVNNSALPSILSCIKEKYTAMEIQDRYGVERIIVFACNPVLFVHMSLAV